MEELIREKLTFHFPHIINSFGSIENFMAVLLATDSLTDEKLHALLAHPGEAVVISPLNLSFRLYDNYANITGNSSIILEEPYSVYSVTGELLYRVTSHDGVFGHSILDRALILQSRPADFYYLHYNTYEGKKTVLMIVNALIMEPKKKVSIGPTLHEQSPVDLVTDQTNSILFKVTNGYRNMGLPGLPLYPAITYFLPAPPAFVPTRSAIASSPMTEKVTFELEIDPTFVLNPQTSGWLIINQESLTGEQPLKVTNMSGAGIDRFLETTPGIYYIGVGSEIDVHKLRQSLGVLGQQALPVAGTQAIRISAGLSKN